MRLAEADSYVFMEIQEGAELSQHLCGWGWEYSRDQMMVTLPPPSRPTWQDQEQWLFTASRMRENSAGSLHYFEANSPVNT